MTKQWIQLDDAVINLSKVDVVHKTYYGVSNSNIPVITFTIGEEEVRCRISAQPSF